MFSRKQPISGTRYWDRAFLTELAKMLHASHFSKVRFRLPRNLVPAKQKDLISLETFLDRERNYPSIILIAQNPKSKETIKILFVNISKETYFIDDTFPSGHSQKTEIYVQSPDPARAYSLLAYFHEYINSQGKGYPSTFLALILAFVLISEILSFFSFGSLLLSGYFANSALVGLDAFALFICVTGLYNYLASPQGLHVRLRDSKFGIMLSKAIRGELRDNPVVNLVVAILGTFLATLVLKLLGII